MADRFFVLWFMLLAVIWVGGWAAFIMWAIYCLVVWLTA